jgi:hypothetical protein
VKKTDLENPRDTKLKARYLTIVQNKTNFLLSTVHVEYIVSVFTVGARPRLHCISAVETVKGMSQERHQQEMGSRKAFEIRDGDT